MPEPLYQTFVMPTIGREQMLPSHASNALQVRRTFWVAAPAGTVRAGVDSDPLQKSTGLEELVTSLSKARGDAQEHFAESERTSLQGVDALRVRSEWVDRGISWRAVDLVWIVDGVAWHAWAMAPAIMPDSGALALDELVQRNAENVTRPAQPSPTRWEAAVEAWGKVRS